VFHKNLNANDTKIRLSAFYKRKFCRQILICIQIPAMSLRNFYIIATALIFKCAFLQAQNYNPVADLASVLQSGNARFTVLTDRVIRMEYSTNKKFNDQASLTFVNRNLPVPSFHQSENKGWLIVQTKYATLHYLENSGPFTKSNLYITYHDGAHDFTWKPGMKDSKNLKGTTRTLDGVSGKFSIYGFRKIHLEDGILSRSGWALIDDSEKPLFDNSNWPWVEARAGGDTQDLYFFGYGTNYKAALYDFMQVAGKISMPPKFAFGVWYSRYWNYTEQQFKDIVNDYNRYQIPLDVLVIDMDWHLTEQSSPEIFSRYAPKPNGWTGFTWEKKYFPDYKEFLSWTNEQKIQTCMNIHPAAGVQAHEAAYPAFAKAMGVDTTNHPAIPFDITNIKGVNPTFYLNYVHFSDMQRQGKRPLIFHRWGGLGNHRYEIGFSGDYLINWKSLDYQPEFTASAANVGFGYWSHDIGGHMNPVSKKDKHDPELFTRWVQWGAFSPIFRTHATKDGEIERRIWKYPDANFNAMRKALQERYALLPYIYTMARFAYDSGISMIRPMYYEYPDMEKAYHLEHQYFFGNDMIVAPITKSMNGKNTIIQTVWLPKGMWFDYNTGEAITGGGMITRSYTLDQVPIFIKATSIIPMQTPKLRIDGSVLDTLILSLHHYTSSTFDMYEDDGNSENYRKNIGSYTRFDCKQFADGIKLSVVPDGKEFEGQVTARTYQFKIAGIMLPEHVVMDGAELIRNKDWTFDDDKKLMVITTPKESIKKSLSIEVYSKEKPIDNH
jgi:alpha-glucosidase (family GH31 glycosyl hydrolase)